MLPVRFAAWCRDPVSGQPLCNRPGRFPAHEFPIDPLDYLGLLRIHHRRGVLVFAAVIAEEVLVREGDLPIGKAFPLAPSDVFGDGAALLLG